MYLSSSFVSFFLGIYSCSFTLVFTFPSWNLSPSASFLQYFSSFSSYNIHLAFHTLFFLSSSFPCLTPVRSYLLISLPIVRLKIPRTLSSFPLSVFTCLILPSPTLFFTYLILSFAYSSPTSPFSSPCIYLPLPTP